MPYDKNLVIKAAKAEIGYLEKKSGDLRYLYDKKANAGSANYTKYGYELRKIYPEVIDYPAAWCSCFVSWLFVQCYGVSDARKLMGGDFDDYTVRQANLYKEKGAWYSTPEIGDQIFFKNDTRICHTGIVVDIIPSSNTVVTVEGNTSNGTEVVSNGGAVCMKYYGMSNARIAGYGRPAYGNQYAFTPHWVRSGDDWYYRVADGVNAHDWRKINGHWYWFDEKGKMTTGSRKIDGAYYFFAPAEMTADEEGALCKTSESGGLYPWYVD